MTFLPIVERELRVAARRPVTHWLRLGVALLGFAATLLVLSNSRRMGNSVQVGSAIFTAISISALGFCLMAGPFLTADTLTSEKREGTLGLLFLTDLRPFDIISGKLAAASLNALLVFLSTVPLLMLPVLWGGVSLKQVLLTALSLALALGVSLAIGVFYSTVCRHHRLAVLATLTTVLLLGGLPFLVLATECSLRGSTAAFSLGCLFVSPVALFVEALQGSRLFRTAPPMLPVGVVFQTAIILTAGMAACRWLPRVAREGDTPPTTRRPRPARLRGSAELHPFWLAGRDTATRRFLFWTLVVLGVVCLALASIAVAKSKGDLLAVALCVAFFMHLLFKCLFAAEVTDRFYHDRATGNLELLLTTPCPPQAILSGHWAGLRHRFGAARGFLTLVNCVLVLALFTDAGPRSSSEEFWVPGLVVAGMVFLYLDCQALFWTGLHCALKARGTGRAFAGAVGRILLPGWLAIFLFFFAGFSGLLRGNDPIHAFLLLWMAGFVTWDFTVTGRLRHRLSERLRVLASEPRGTA